MNVNRLTQINLNLKKVAAHSQCNRFDTQKANRSAQEAIRILNNAFLYRAWNPQKDRKFLTDIKHSIETIKSNQNDFLQHSQLAFLEEKVNMVFQFGMIKTTFNAQAIPSSLPEKLIGPFYNLFNLLTRRFADLIRKEVYHGWSEKIKYTELRNLVEKEYLAKYDNWFQKNMEQADTKKQCTHVQNIYDQEQAMLQKQVNENNRLQANNELKAKAEETKELFTAIGGERIQLKTSDGVNLDATYLSCNEFKLVLQEQKGKRVAYVFGEEEIKGISLKANNPDFIVKLQQLGLLGTSQKPGSGYGLLYDDHTCCYVIATKEDLQNLSRTKAIFYDEDKNFYVLEKKPSKFIEKPISLNNAWFKVSDSSNDEKAKKPSVAILSSGNAGVYEMHKGEALTLLMNGCDVMMLNLRGYGDSEGEPSVKGNYNDLEAAYQFVKKQKNIPDHRIAAWALCLSGGMAAHLAEKHPKINLFLNQTYAEFWNILKNQLDNEIEKFFKKHFYHKEEKSLLRDVLKKCLSPLISTAVKLVSPNYNVKNRLSKIKGKICIMRATDDSLMTKNETDQMKAALRENHTNCQFVEIPGEHCTAWNQVVIYQDWKGREIVPHDYTWVSLDNQSIFIPIKDLNSVKGFRFISLDGTSYHFFLDPHTPENKVKVDIYSKNNPRYAKELLTLECHEISEEIIPQFINTFNLTSTYQGHHHIRQFLCTAGMADPLI